MIRLTTMIAMLVMMSSLATAQLYTIGQTDGDENLRELDPATGAVLNTIPVTGSAGLGFNAMAQDPVTDRVYVIEDGTTNTDRPLGTVDISTGAYTLIGQTGFPMNSLAFLPDGRLFALVGITGSNDSEVYQLDKSTGAATFVAMIPLVNPLGSSMMFDPASGDLLCYGGCPSDSGFLLDPDSLVITPLSMFPATGSEIQGGAPSAAGDIVVTDFNSLYRITSAGTATLIGPTAMVRGIIEFTERVNAPGTGEDLESFFSFNGGSMVTVGAADDVITMVPGDTLSFGHISPMGTFTLAGDLASVGSILGGGVAAPVLFPGIHVDPAAAFVMSNNVAGFPPQLPATGFSYAFVYSGGPLVGLDLLLQGFVISGPPAANGIFASTDGFRVELR